MQWLALIASFVFGRMNSRSVGIRQIAVEAFHEISHRSRRIVTLSLTGLAAVIFFCGGLFIALLDGTSQYDRTGAVFATSTLWAGVALMLIAVVTFAVVFLRAWPGARARTQMHRKHESIHDQTGMNLEQALSELVMDFVNDRRVRRQRKASSSSFTATEPSPRESRREERRRAREEERRASSSATTETPDSSQIH